MLKQWRPVQDKSQIKEAFLDQECSEKGCTLRWRWINSYCGPRDVIAIVLRRRVTLNIVRCNASISGRLFWANLN